MEKIRATALIFIVAGTLCAIHAPIILLIAYVIVLFGIGVQEVKKDEDRARRNNIEKR